MGHPTASALMALSVGWLLPSFSQAAADATLLELELNGERISRGSLVYRHTGGCRVDSKDIQAHLRLATPPDWTDFTHQDRTCVIDERLGVARLHIDPALLKTRQLMLFKRADAVESMSADNSIALDFVANRNGLRTGLILSQEGTQLSLSLNPRGRLEYWTGSWQHPTGVYLEAGDITSPLALSGAPQRFQGLRLASSATRSASSGLAIAHILLQHPSRIRMINGNAQEVLGVTALPAGPYRVIGPTGTTAPGFLRVQIEGADGVVSEQILPWSHHAQILDEGKMRWEVSADAHRNLFGTVGKGLSAQDSLWLSASSTERSARLDWVTSRMPAVIWTGSLGLSCRHACSPTAGGAVQAPLWKGSHLQATWQSGSRPQISVTGAIGSGGTIALALGPQHLHAQAHWAISSRIRMGLSLTQSPTAQSIHLQWHFALGKSESMSITQRQQGAELQIAQTPTTPGALGWNVRANPTQLDLALHQQPYWGDWHAQLTRSNRGGPLTFYPQVSTRLWLTEHTTRLGPVGEYNLVEINTGVSGLELIDHQGQTATTDARGVAAFARIPAHASVGLRVNSQRLPLDRAMPFNQVLIQTDRRRAYRLIKHSAPALTATYRIDPRSAPQGFALADAQGLPLYVSPDGYIDFEPRHQLPLSTRTPKGPLACNVRIERDAQLGTDEHWVRCDSR